MSQPARSRATAEPRREGSRIALDRTPMTRRTGLSLPPTLPLDAWKQIGEELFLILDASVWWQGDWLVYGQDRYPDRYPRALEETGLDYQTLRNYAWVARKFEPSRRRAGLSMQHHAEVASLPEEEQDYWLDRAEEARWSRNMLRRHLQARRLGGGARGHDNATLSMKIDSGQRQRWQDAAERTGHGLINWIAEVLDQAAENTLQALPDTPGRHRAEGPLHRAEILR
jgi:hypothetical protein